MVVGDRVLPISSCTPSRQEILARYCLTSLARNITARPCKTWFLPNLTGSKAGDDISQKDGTSQPFGFLPLLTGPKLLFYYVMTVGTHVCTRSQFFLIPQGCKMRPRSCKKSHILISHGPTARPNSNNVVL